MVRRNAFCVHVRDHQHVAGPDIGRDAGDQPVGVELRGEQEATPRPLLVEEGFATSK